MSIKIMTIGQLAKEQPPFPEGTGTIEAQALSVKSVTKKTKMGEDLDTDEFTLSIVPTVPGVNVDPDALAEIDQNTGKPVYEGQRVFLKFAMAFPQARRELASALAAFGYGVDTNPYELADAGNTSIRGRVARGYIFHRHYHRNDDAPGVDTGLEQKVQGKTWSKVAKGAEYNL